MSVDEIYDQVPRGEQWIMSLLQRNPNIKILKKRTGYELEAHTFKRYGDPYFPSLCAVSLLELVIENSLLHPQFLTEVLADPRLDRNSCFPVFAAIYGEPHWKTDILECVVRAGCSVVAFPKGHITPLARCTGAEKTQILLEAGADWREPHDALQKAIQNDDHGKIWQILLLGKVEPADLSRPAPYTTPGPYNVLDQILATGHIDVISAAVKTAAYQFSATNQWRVVSMLLTRKYQDIDTICMWKEILGSGDVPLDMFIPNISFLLRDPHLVCFLLACGVPLTIEWLTSHCLQFRQENINGFAPLTVKQLILTGKCSWDRGWRQEIMTVNAQRFHLIKARATEVLIGLQPLNISAGELMEIVEFACEPFANCVPPHMKWAVICTVKHFKKIESA